MACEWKLVLELFFAGVTDTLPSHTCKDLLSPQIGEGLKILQKMHVLCTT